MAENEIAVQEQSGTAEETEFQYEIKIEDAGPAAKKVSVEIPQERIAAKLAEQFKELRREAAIPGFRPGHAPQKLIEKRFNSDVREQVRRTLVSESYEQAVKKHSLNVIGQPEFDKPDEISLPESGNLSYSFQVEVQPEIILPQLTGVKVKKTKVKVNDQYIDQAMKDLREQQGSLIPVEDRGVEKDDRLIADVHVKLDGKVVAHRHDALIVAKPGRVAAIRVADLDLQLAGLKPGEKRDIQAHAPDTHPSEEIRGKDLVIEVALKDLKRLELAEITPEFLDSLGFENEQQLRDALKEQMKERVKYNVQDSMRQQINNYLLQYVQMDVPAKLSAQQADRVIQRRAIELRMRGLTEEQVATQIEMLRSGAQDEATRELKLFFILNKVAGQQNVEVSEAELNGRISIIAAQDGRRPEKLKQEMAADGSLQSMYVQMREQKAIDKILETAEIEEVEPPKPGEDADDAKE